MATGTRSSVLDRAYARLHTQVYKEKAYVNFEQYCFDLLAVKKHNAKACAKRARRDGTIGDILDRAMTMDTFGFFLNLVIYRAKSGLGCQFGSTPNEAIMKQLKSYNSNVLTSTANRANLTLDMFCFTKVMTHYMRTQVENTWPYNGTPSSVGEITYAVLRKMIADGDLKKPSLTHSVPHKSKRVLKRPSSNDLKSDHKKMRK